VATSTLPETDLGNNKIDAFHGAMESFGSSTQSKSMNDLEPTPIRNNNAKSGSGIDTSKANSVVQTSQAAAADTPAPIGLKYITIIPPTHPLLREFAEQYLPYFENSSSTESGTGDSNQNAEGQGGV
jgi:hypothetical protein